jgi:hypothetical protein
MNLCERAVEGMHGPGNWTTQPSLFALRSLPRRHSGQRGLNLQFQASFDDTSPQRIGTPALLVFCLRLGYVNAAAKRRAQSRESSSPTKAELICT